MLLRQLALLSAAAPGQWLKLIPLLVAIVSIVHLLYFAITGTYIDRFLCSKQPANWGISAFVLLINFVVLLINLFVYCVFIAVLKQ